MALADACCKALLFVNLLYRDPYIAESVVAPDPFDPVSKRRFDGRVKKWRRCLHRFDPQNEEERRELEDWLMLRNVYLCNVYCFKDF